MWTPHKWTLVQVSFSFLPSLLFASLLFSSLPSSPLLFSPLLFSSACSTYSSSVCHLCLLAFRSLPVALAIVLGALLAYSEARAVHMATVVTGDPPPPFGRKAPGRRGIRDGMHRLPLSSEDAGPIEYLARGLCGAVHKPELRYPPFL